MSGCFQAASFPKPKRLSGPTQEISFHKGSFPDHSLGDLCVWARLGINMLLLGEIQCWPFLLLCALSDTVLVSLQSPSTPSMSCDLSQRSQPSVEAFSMAGVSVVRAVVASSSSLAPSWFLHRSQS